MSNIKACIFDLDGTLTNTINAIAHFGNIALAAFGLPEIPVEDYKIYVGDGRDKLIHRMLGVYGKDNAEMFEKVRDVYDENYENDYLLYKMKIDTNLTNEVGQVQFRVHFIQVEMNEEGKEAFIKFVEMVGEK